MASDHKALLRILCTAQYITGNKHPPIQDLYTRQCQRKALKIVKGSSHPSHRLFSLLPHGKRYQSARYLAHVTNNISFSFLLFGLIDSEWATHTGESVFILHIVSPLYDYEWTSLEMSPCFCFLIVLSASYWSSQWQNTC